MKDSPRTMRLASVDIGTLTCRLLIADLSPSGKLIEVRSERRILRLGEGVDQTKRLSVAAMDRVLQCLREWRELVDAAHVDATAVVATSAVRDAGNRNEFLDRVQREAGFEVELISGEEEAQRTMLGIRSGLPLGVTDVLALDIGGGSTEFILDRPNQPPTVRSIDIGVVRLCERLLHHDPPTDVEVRQAREWIAKETKTAVAAMGNYHGATFVGTAGTVTSLAAMAQKLSTYEPARIHNYQLQLTTIQELEQTLLSRKKTDRAGLPGLEKGREEVIAAGAIIIRTVMETLGRKVCLVSDLGLREGVLLNLALRRKRDTQCRLTQEEAFKVVNAIAEDFHHYLKKYEERKYPPTELAELRATFSNPMLVTETSIRRALIWKYGNWGKKRIPQAHERITKKITVAWRESPPDGIEPKGFLEWWAHNISKTSFITGCFVFHLLGHENVPILDQHNYRAVNYYFRQVRPGWQGKAKPSRLEDLVLVRDFMEAVLQNWSDHISYPKPSLDELDRFLMMFGKSRKVKAS